MIRRCACVIAAVTYFSACVALAQDAVGASRVNWTAPIAEPQLTNAENPSLRQPPPPGNPLWRIPLNSLSVTRERPLFRRRVARPHRRRHRQCRRQTPHLRRPPNPSCRL